MVHKMYVLTRRGAWALFLFMRFFFFLKVHRSKAYKALKLPHRTLAWFTCVLGIAFFIAVACGDKKSSNSERKAVESSAIVAEDTACISEDSNLDINDCYLFPESISKDKAHYFYFTCEENEAIPDPAEYCRIHMRGVMFVLDPVIHLAINQGLSPDQPQIPAMKLRLWLTESINKPTWNQDHSLELVAKLMSGKDKDNTNVDKLWITYFPLYTTSFKAINSFLQSNASVDSSGIFLTLHEDMHKVTGAPENVKAANHRALGSSRLLSSFLVAAKDLAERTPGIHQSMVLNEASLSALKKWEDILPSDPYEDLKKEYAKFHNDRCIISLNYFVFWKKIPYNCGNPLTNIDADPATTGPPPPPT